MVPAKCSPLFPIHHLKVIFVVHYVSRVVLVEAAVVVAGTTKISSSASSCSISHHLKVRAVVLYVFRVVLAEAAVVAGTTRVAGSSCITSHHPKVRAVVLYVFRVVLAETAVAVAALVAVAVLVDRQVMVVAVAVMVEGIPAAAAVMKLADNCRHCLLAEIPARASVVRQARRTHCGSRGPACNTLYSQLNFLPQRKHYTCVAVPEV